MINTLLALVVIAWRTFAKQKRREGKVALFRGQRRRFLPSGICARQAFLAYSIFSPPLLVRALNTM